MTRKTKKENIFSEQEKEILYTPPRLSVSQCADKFRLLSGKTARFPGKWKTLLVPFMREIMDSFSIPCIEEIWFKKPVQVGATEALLNMILYANHQNPGPAMIVEPTEALANEISIDRIDPMIQGCDFLSLVSYEENSTQKRKSFAEMDLYLAWAGSPTSLASRPIRYVFMDEVNKYDTYSGREASPIALAKARTRTFSQIRKLVYVSTPTTPDGYITTGEEDCQARFRYFVPCPHCGFLQLFTFPNIKWPEGEKEPEKVYSVAWYECESCKQRIHDRNKENMVRKGKWIDQQSGFDFDECIKKIKPRTVGFHINSIYSPFVTFGEVARDFLKAKDDPALLMDWKTQMMAEEWEEKIIDEIEETEENYKFGYLAETIPGDAEYLTAGVDVHDGPLYYVIRAWSKTGESWLISYGMENNFEDIGSMTLGRNFVNSANQKKMFVNLAAIDSGYRTGEVYDFVKKHGRRAMGVKGSSSPMQTPYRTTNITKTPQGMAIRDGLILWTLNTDYWKDIISSKMKIKEQNRIIWHVPDDVSKEYMDQITSEHKVIKWTTSKHKRGKLIVWEMKKGKRGNHYWDAEVYAMAAAGLLPIALSISQRREEPVLAEQLTDGIVKPDSIEEIEKRTMPIKTSYKKSLWVGSKKGWMK